MNPDPLEVWIADELQQQVFGCCVPCEREAKEVAAIIAQHYEPLLAEVERLREDAARYRWLRDESCPPHNFYVSVPDEFKGVRYSAHEVDTYIDAARLALAASDPTHNRP